jgi:hypothetical protein
MVRVSEQGAVIRDKRRKAVLDALGRDNERGLTVAEVIEATGIEQRGCYRAVNDLRDTGIITKDADGYWRRQSSAGVSIAPPRIPDLHRRDVTIPADNFTPPTETAGDTAAVAADDTAAEHSPDPPTIVPPRPPSRPSNLSAVAVRQVDPLNDPRNAAEAVRQGVEGCRNLAAALAADAVPIEYRHRAITARQELSGLEWRLAQARDGGMIRAVIAEATPAVMRAQELLVKIQRQLGQMLAPAAEVASRWVEQPIAQPDWTRQRTTDLVSPTGPSVDFDLRAVQLTAAPIARETARRQARERAAAEQAKRDEQVVRSRRRNDAPLHRLIRR